MARWTAQQIVEACPDDTAPVSLLRDRDHVYGDAFRQRVAGLRIRDVLTAAHHSWQNPFVERLIGSVRRECLDHVLVLSERHLRRISTRYVAYYHRARTHLSLQKDAPDVSLSFAKTSFGGEVVDLSVLIRSPSQLVITVLLHLLSAPSFPRRRPSPALPREPGLAPAARRL